MDIIAIKRATLAIGAIVFFILLLGTINILGRSGKTLVTFEFAPSLAQAKLDSKIIHSGKVYVSKGKHTLTLKLQNFDSATQVIDVHDKDTIISLAISPINEAGRKLLTNNPQYQLEREAVGGLAKNFQAQLDTTPLIALLPAVSITDSYRIEYGDSISRPGQTVIIITDSSPNGRQNALKWIRSKGFNPTRLEIEYRDYANPLTLGYVTQGGLHAPTTV